MDILSDLFTDLCELIYRAIADILSWVLALLREWAWVALSDEIYYAAIPFVPQFQVVVAASYALLIAIGGFVVMSQESLQTRYSIREIAPRLIVGFLLSGLAVTICYQAFQLNWQIVSAFLDTPYGFVPESGTETAAFEDEFGMLGWSEEMTAADYLLATVYKLVCIVAVALLLVTAILRNIAWFFVIALSPAALACHALPVTERFAVYWWRMLGACLASSIGQAILIWIYVQMTGSLYFGMINDIVPMDGVYAIVLVWMMWRLHLEVFKIARGRPLSVPGSRLLAAAFLSKAASGGRDRKIAISDKAWGRKLEPPWKRRRKGSEADGAAPDRFPDLPPEPEGFGPWADFRTGQDDRRDAASARDAEPPSPLRDAAPVPAGGDGPVRVRPVRYPEGGHRPAPTDPQAGPAPDSPLGDAGPEPEHGAVPLSEVRDGTLLRVQPPEEPPTVRVRTADVVPLAERRAEATDANREREADAVAEANKIEARALQEQTELRRRAQAAMRRMAAGGTGAAVHEVPPAREEHAFPPPKAAPRPEGGER
ncbi:hypothetical protein LO763_11765 [Glycomyces sp. A-F 0318]|uniref:hypothetical protein n=1 Tax=Glycomyces amatae TaxID=2881355 RepID=UPI001E5C03A3|nr:hypothetical protein [Glycomyces amatae]MCD0444299.1 hypothetical protein [Glycomyces amatae]